MGLEDALPPAHAFPQANSVLAAMFCIEWKILKWRSQLEFKERKTTYNELVGTNYYDICFRSCTD